LVRNFLTGGGCHDYQPPDEQGTNRGWRGDVELASLEGTGLTAPSMVRTAKIATIDQSLAEKISTLPAGPARAAVLAAIGTNLSPAGAKAVSGSSVIASG
jgi:hypothetical protein